MFGAAGSWYYSTLAGLGRAPGSRSWQNLVIAPPAAADVLSQLSYASASIDSSMGLVGAAWTAGNAPAMGSVCGGPAPEKSRLSLKCVGGTFTSVAFASYGVPTGSCDASAGAPPAINASCHAPTSADVVAALCVGKAACTIDVNTTTFGGVDPCFDVPKFLITALDGTCSGISYSVDATVPVGARASVVVPTRGSSAATAIISEGGAVVWRAGAFVPGTPGIAGAVAAGDSVEFNVGSGVYSFTVAL
jgi:hypothetical protein